MGGAILVGLMVIFFAPGQRWVGFSLLGVGIVIALILQFLFGEDVIRFRKPKKM